MIDFCVCARVWGGAAPVEGLPGVLQRREEERCKLAAALIGPETLPCEQNAALRRLPLQARAK